ncbi:MAG: 3,4-dihydroxy-2-butanone-4-phosphate synthase [Alphaproteobacteria bacterium]|nr:3,4-dihydroxy-2-butanone-4-phosphate synthase [Alphaproteobacteria bacterium]
MSNVTAARFGTKNNSESNAGAADVSVLAPIEEIIADIRAGRPVVIVDDEDRENEGDLIIAAAHATPEIINFMIQECGGFVCLPMDSSIVNRLGLSLQARQHVTDMQARFTVSIEAREGISTGVSAHDRARTIAVAADPKAGPDDIATPGHVFPLLACDGGVLRRAGHTEAAVDLARLAGLQPAGVLCEIMNKDGSMARLPDLLPFAQRYGLKIGSIADLIAYRRRTESLVKRIHQSTIDSHFGGVFDFYLYANTVQYAEHIALVKGDITKGHDPVLVRMHAVDIMGDVLGLSPQAPLQRAMEKIGAAGRGVIVLLRDANPQGLSQRLDHEKSHNTILRDYGIGAQILRDLGVRTMTLLTNTPKTVAGLDGYDLHIAGYEPL